MVFNYKIKLQELRGKKIKTLTMDRLIQGDRLTQYIQVPLFAVRCNRSINNLPLTKGHLSPWLWLLCVVI